MSLADRTADPAAVAYGNQGPRCFFERLYTILDDDDRQTVDGWLADPMMPTSEIARLLAPEGASNFKVGYHRRGDCRCPR